MAWNYREVDPLRDKAGLRILDGIGIGMLAIAILASWKLGFDTTSIALGAIIILNFTDEMRRPPVATDNPKFNAGMETTKLHLRLIFGGFSLVVGIMIVAGAIADGHWGEGMDLSLPFFALASMSLVGSFDRYRQIKNFEAKLVSQGGLSL